MASASPSAPGAARGSSAASPSSTSSRRRASSASPTAPSRLGVEDTLLAVTRSFPNGLARSLDLGRELAHETAGLVEQRRRAHGSALRLGEPIAHVLERGERAIDLGHGGPPRSRAMRARTPLTNAPASGVA